MAEKGTRRILQGVVVSNKMQKSVVVKVDRSFAHSQYGKIIRRSKKYLAHDENQQCTIGDTVTIIEMRPLSKNKCWRVKEILFKAD